MIQRIQSIYLLATVMICVIMFFFPVLIKVIPVNSQQIDSREICYKMNVSNIETYKDKVLDASSLNLLLLFLNVATGIISLLTIFLYKKRMQQVMLCRAGILSVLIFIVTDFFYLSEAVGKENGNIDPHYMAGSYFPFIQIILLFMAMRAIKKDEELVKSADRIR